MKLVYICSPLAGDIENNLRFARAACRYAADQGCAPIAVHLLYPQILNDAVPAEREAGIRMGLRVLASCEELWVCSNRISHGMCYEIAEAEQLGIPIRTASAEQIQSGIFMEAEQLTRDVNTPNGPSFLEKMEIMPEEAPSLGMELRP